MVLLLLPTTLWSLKLLNTSYCLLMHTQIHFDSGLVFSVSKWLKHTLFNKYVPVKKNLNSWVLELFILVARHNILRRSVLYSHEWWTAPFFHCYLVIRLLCVNSIFFFNAIDFIIPFLYSTLFQKISTTKPQWHNC